MFAGSQYTKSYTRKQKSLEMNNFIFKSSKGLIKNSSVNLDNLMKKLDLVLLEQRHQRSDLQDIQHKLDRLLVDKHLQMQVDEYFNRNPDDDSPNSD